MTTEEMSSWIINLLNEIQIAAESGENYDLHLESIVVNEIADAYKDTTWIEIY